MARNAPLLVVNISGAQGSGKTVMADLLAGELNRRAGKGWFSIAKRRALADPLKDMARTLTDDPNFEKASAYPIGPDGSLLSGRRVLQLLGTEGCRRLFREDVWLWLARRRAGEGELTIIDDCRFPNERMAGDFSVWLDASGHAPPADAHESESHHRALRETADLVVLRRRGIYSPPLCEVAEEILRRAKTTLKP